MKKTLALVMAAAILMIAASCGGAPAPSDAPTTPQDGKFELALIINAGTIDDKSFNQGAWEGLTQYATEKNISHKYYKPTEQSTDACLSAIELAIKGGAKAIVCPGFLFEEPIFFAQDQHPDVKFILLDCIPNRAYEEFKTSDNTVAITYAEEQAGFLAGYAAVKDGYTKLGFMGGMAVPSAVRYGYGFVQGAEYAAKEMGIAQVSIYYHYTGGFDATPEAQTMAASWYQGGIEVIFACSGAVGNSIMAAAAPYNGKVIGVDVDQSYESESVITSAMKGVGASVYTTLGQLYEGQFPGGQNLVYRAANNGVSLPMATSRFQKFTQADYDKIFGALVADTDKLSSNIFKDTQKPVTDIPVSIVKITEIK